MITYLWIAVGGAFGSMARYWMTLAVAAWTGPRFPWGTIAVNVIGSFVIGIVAFGTTPVGRVPISFDVRNFILVGICGGFTTFSSFSLQTLELLRGGHWFEAGANILMSVVLCLAGVWAGYAAAGIGAHPAGS